jgi:putative transposase
MTDTFIQEIPWQTTPHHEAELEVRLEKARHLYNGRLRESPRRLDLMRESKAYQSARTLPKGKARTGAFAASRKDHGFREYHLHCLAGATCKACWIVDHPDARTIQKIASPAFRACEQHAFGGPGRPRFKHCGWLISLEGKSNTSGIRWKDDQVLSSCLKLQPLFDPKDKHGVEVPALSSRVRVSRARQTDRELRTTLVRAIGPGRHPAPKRKRTPSAKTAAASA